MGAGNTLGRGMGRGKGTKAKVQQAILRRRGLGAKPYGMLDRKSLPPSNGLKTLAMRLMEARFGVPLEDLLREGTLSEVAELLGIDQSTVSKWRLRLNLRQRAE